MKIFVIVSRIPYPLEKGDKLRAYHQLRYLAKSHEVHLCCLSDRQPDQSAIAHLESVCASVEVIRLSRFLIFFRLFLALFSSRPFQVHYFYQRAAARMVAQLIESIKPDHIYCQLIRCSEYVKHIHHIPKTLDYMDAFNKGMERLSDRSTFFMRRVWRIEARRLVRYENLIFDYFDFHTIISKQDRDLIYHPKRKSIAVVPNGVDTDFFVSGVKKARQTVVFTGNMSYPPNIDTAEILAIEVMPLVRKQLPNAELLLAGAAPHPRVSALSQEPHTQVTGWMDDIRVAYTSGTVFAAPLRIGTGLQNKLLEAMSMELPCVTSTLANNALGATSGEHLCIADDSEGCAKEIIRLLQDQDEQHRLGNAARAFVVGRYSWDGATKKLTELMVSKQ